MSTLAYGVITVGWPGVTFLRAASQLAAALLAGSGVAPVQFGLAAHVIGVGHGGDVAEQRRVDDPGRVGIGVAGPGGQQGGQAAARVQARGQVVTGQGGAHLVVRLVDERP